MKLGKDEIRQREIDNLLYGAFGAYITAITELLFWGYIEWPKVGQMFGLYWIVAYALDALEYSNRVREEEKMKEKQREKERKKREAERDLDNLLE